MHSYTVCFALLYAHLPGGEVPSIPMCTETVEMFHVCFALLYAHLPGGEVPK